MCGVLRELSPLWSFSAGSSCSGRVRRAAPKKPNDAGFLIAGSKSSAGVGLVRVFADNDLNGKYETLADEFVPYATTTADGVRVAAGDIDGDINDELIVASAENAPVKVYELTASGEVGALEESLVGFTQGAFVAAGDIDGDGRDEVILGSDPGGEPKVKIYADTNGTARLRLRRRTRSTPIPPVTAAASA